MVRASHQFPLSARNPFFYSYYLVKNQYDKKTRYFLFFRFKTTALLLFPIYSFILFLIVLYQIAKGGRSNNNNHILLTRIIYEIFEFMLKKNISEQALLRKIHQHDGKKDLTISCGDHLILKVSGRIHKCDFFYRPKMPKGFSQKIYRVGEHSNEFGLTEARKRIRELKEEIKEKEAIILLEEEKGIEKEMQKRGIKDPKRSFGYVAECWLNNKSKLKHFPNYRRCVDFLKPLYKYDVADIKNMMVKDCLLDPKKRISAYKIRETVWVLCSIMDLALEDDLIESHNCAVLKTSSAFPKLGLTEGYKFAPVNQLSSIFAKLQDLPFRLRSYFLFLCLSCLRPGECRKLKFSYFDFNTNCIYVPGELMKVKKLTPFRVPLTPQMKQIFKRCQANRHDDNEYLFPAASYYSGKPVTEGEISTAMKMATGGTVHCHGFRKTARSWFAEQAVSAEVAAKCLDHVLSTGSDGFYQKSDLFDLRAVVMKQYSETIFAQIENIDFYLRD